MRRIRVHSYRKATSSGEHAILTDSQDFMTMIAIMGDGFKILCDGDGCRADADAPVALRPALGDGLSDKKPIEEWLFVASVGGVEKHYCPACQASYLEGLREHAAPPR